MLFTILYIAHLCTCAWHFYSDYLYRNDFTPDTILVLQGLVEKNVFERYVEIYYYSVMTMITVNHIKTDNAYEKIWSIVLSLMLAGVFAYTINTVGAIL